MDLTPSAALLAGSLIGLVRACGTGQKTPRTDALLWQGLAALSDGSDPAAARQAVMAEKALVVPNCAFCAAPCGNTADFDLQSLQSGSPAARSLKLELLACWSARAVACPSGWQQPETVELMHRALFLVGYELPPEDLEKLLAQCKALPLC